MAEQKDLEWYEYAEAEQQIAVLQRHIDAAIEDLNMNTLSSFSRSAIMNEIQRHIHFIDDIREQMGGPTDTEPIDISEIGQGMS